MSSALAALRRWDPPLQHGGGHCPRRVFRIGGSRSGTKGLGSRLASTLRGRGSPCTCAHAQVGKKGAGGHAGGRERCPAGRGAPTTQRMLSTSRPRAATSVATSTPLGCCLNLSSACGPQRPGSHPRSRNVHHCDVSKGSASSAAPATNGGTRCRLCCVVWCKVCCVVWCKLCCVA